MITENYVSFETAKLLKENGFSENTEHEIWYVIKQFSTGCHWNSCTYKVGDITREYDDACCISMPTHQMAMKWLREVHNILIVVDYEWECDTTPYYFKIYRLGENGKPERVPVKGVSYDKDDIPTEHIVGYRDWERSNDDFKSYEQACEIAIKYCLENLI